MSLLYALTNAFYISYNDKHHYNGYILGIWRGFGVSLCTLPFLFLIPVNISLPYFIILAVQGILIGIYDSRLFFASARYGSNASSGFMTTCVLITAFLWWGIEIDDFKELLQTPRYFMILMFLLCTYTISYWQMMKPHLNLKAELYLYPATFALSFMSIATRFIAIHGGSMLAGIFCYLTISCFVSGIYNSLAYIKNRKKVQAKRNPTLKQGLWLIFLSATLIAAKTAAMRLCENPAYVIAVLLTSPIITILLEKHRMKWSPIILVNIILLIFLLVTVTFKNAILPY